MYFTNSILYSRSKYAGFVCTVKLFKIIFLFLYETVPVFCNLTSFKIFPYIKWNRTFRIHKYISFLGWISLFPSFPMMLCWCPSDVCSLFNMQFFLRLPLIHLFITVHFFFSFIGIWNKTNWDLWWSFDLTGLYLKVDSSSHKPKPTIIIYTPSFT